MFMLAVLSLKNKILFIALSTLWTSIFIYWIYVGHCWANEQYLKSNQDDSSESYYP